MSTLSLRTRRDPFTELDAVLDGLARRAGAPAGGRGFVPAAELDRDGDDALVRLELPGLDPERDVTVEVADGRLVVRGERRDERTEDRDGRRLREVRYGSFRRSFGLPAQIGAEAVSASYDAGVLTVRVAGAHAGSTARQIPVSRATAQSIEPGSTESGDQPAA